MVNKFSVVIKLLYGPPNANVNISLDDLFINCQDPSLVKVPFLGDFNLHARDHLTQFSELGDIYYVYGSNHLVSILTP